MTESDNALMLRVAKEEIKRQAAEIEYLKARLEVSAYHPYDGIASRDATIKLQDEHIAELQAKYDCNTAIMHARTDAMNRTPPVTATSARTVSASSGASCTQAGRRLTG